jgi:5-carboxymethyl-2-hydroxymuconate isomerase
MPHLVILYTPDLDRPVAQGGSDMAALCRSLAGAMRHQMDEGGKPVFPTGGIRVLAYPAAHHAVADDGEAQPAGGTSPDYGFVYLHLRMGRGRSAPTHQAVGQTLSAVAQAHFAPLLASRHIGITLQIDEGPEVFDAKHSSLHPLFNKPVQG